MNKLVEYTLKSSLVPSRNWPNFFDQREADVFFFVSFFLSCRILCNIIIMYVSKKEVWHRENVRKRENRWHGRKGRQGLSIFSQNPPTFSLTRYSGMATTKRTTFSETLSIFPSKNSWPTKRESCSNLRI